MEKRLFIAPLAFAAGIAIAAPAQASYMSKCNALISAWEKCQAGGGSCAAEKQKIVEQCKCHRLKQGSWKLVMAAVGKDGVCAPRTPKDPPFPPHDPPREKPPVTYGGERGPDDKRRPN